MNIAEELLERVQNISPYGYTGDGSLVIKNDDYHDLLDVIGEALDYIAEKEGVNL